MVEDVLAKCEKNPSGDLKWKVLYDALLRSGPGPRFDARYVDCGPELARAKQKGNVFTYDISKGGLLSGAGHVGTGERFFQDVQRNVVRDLRTNLSKNPPSLFLSIRGGGATNCGAGFLLDREILNFGHSLLLQFIILPYRGEGIEASRVVYLTWQVMELLRESPDRYAPVLLSNEQILAGAASFEQAGMNWFYPLANTIVVDLLARILYPTLYSDTARSSQQGAFELQGRQKYLDMRDFIRQPGFRSVGYSHLDDTVPLDPKALEKLVKDSLGPAPGGQDPRHPGARPHGNPLADDGSPDGLLAPHRSDGRGRRHHEGEALGPPRGRPSRLVPARVHVRHQARQVRVPALPRRRRPRRHPRLVRAVPEEPAESEIQGRGRPSHLRLREDRGVLREDLRALPDPAGAMTRRTRSEVSSGASLSAASKEMQRPPRRPERGIAARD